MHAAIGSQPHVTHNKPGPIDWHFLSTLQLCALLVIMSQYIATMGGSYTQSVWNLDQNTREKQLFDIHLVVRRTTKLYSKNLHCLADLFTYIHSLGAKKK